MSVKGAEGCRLRLNFGAHPLLILCHLCELQQVESAKLSSSLSSITVEKWNADGLKKKIDIFNQLAYNMLGSPKYQICATLDIARPET